MRRDHPRSRGVYEEFCGTLPDQGGIIPARAGFTARQDEQNRRHEDHPRSRGVYSDLLDPEQQYSGSSPLARGLRPHPRAHGRRRRIIPARAGFTGISPRQSEPPKDHPRSRGVYQSCSDPLTSSSGSSPLARGLRSPSAAGPMASGIIPARAGFTRPTRPALSATKDHPRSRGVYPSVSQGNLLTTGSSPLARGLRSALLGLLSSSRIIPARAGFTP